MIDSDYNNTRRVNIIKHSTKINGNSVKCLDELFLRLTKGLGTVQSISSVHKYTKSARELCKVNYRNL